MKVALYARESDDDTNKAPPIEKQIERGKQWVAEQGHELVIVYADDGYSGGDWKRPDWNKAVTDAKRHAYKLLWTWNQDRLARDTEQFLWFCRNLKEKGIQIWEDTANSFIDMDTLGGRVKHQTMAQAAEIFRLVTSDKVKRAYTLNKASGKSWGRPQKIIDLDRAMQLRATGLGWRSIARELGCNFVTLRRRVRNVPK